MTRLISLLLVLLPRSVTGSIRRQAAQIVAKGLRGNETGGAYKRNWLARLLFWGGLHPIWFCVATGCAWAAVSLLLQPPGDAHHWWDLLPKPELPEDKTLAEFFAPVWGVQATLVALVYPIVLSFVAISLQRKASAKVLLRVYILESAVSPAGASSLTLTVVMAIEYLISPYVPSTTLLGAMVFNGGWLASNLLLAGIFLFRTIRFLEDEEGYRSMTRIAVDHVLPTELRDSLHEHLYLGLPHSWRQKGLIKKEQFEPRMGSMWPREGGSEVATFVRPRSALFDVRAELLRRAVTSWSSRVAAMTEQPSNPLAFSPNFSGSSVGGMMSPGVV